MMRDGIFCEYFKIILNFILSAQCQLHPPT
nr:MAG TPA: hypothetical protein [Caudoviricetes sp.]